MLHKPMHGLYPTVFLILLQNLMDLLSVFLGQMK